VKREFVHAMDRRYQGHIVPAIYKSCDFQKLYSELLRDTRLFEDGVCRVARQYSLVDGKPPLSNGTEPNFMIPAALALEITAVGAEDLLHLRRIARHQGTNAPLCSCW
jgi:hypothetical protein